MSLKNQNTTSDILQWDAVKTLINTSIATKQYSLASYIIGGAYYGLKYSTIKKLKWGNVLNENFTVSTEKIVLKEVFNCKESLIYINKIYELLENPPLDSLIIRGKRSAQKPLSVQRINVLLKELKENTKIDINNFSTESLRKTFARRVYDILPINAKVSGLEMLKEYLEQASIQDTKDYIGINDDNFLFKNPFEVLQLSFNYGDIINNENINEIINNIRNEKKSYVYMLIDNSISKYIKIGKTNSLKNREKTLQAQKPTYQMYKYIEVLNSKDAYKIEHELHQRYANRRIRGEWFELDKDEINELLIKYNWKDYK